MDRRMFLGAGTALAACAALPLRAGAGSTFATDIDVVRAAISIHPGALRYLSEAQLASALDELERTYLRAESLPARFLALSGVLAKLKCGHTHCNFYNQPDAIADDLFDRRTRLPFLFRWIDRQMVVTRDLSGSGRLPPGTIVTGIDGRTPAAILAALLPLARADGGNDAKRVAQMEVTGGERFPAFDIFQGLLFPPQNGLFSVAFAPPGGAPATARLPALSPEERLAAASPLPDDGTPLWSLAQREDGIAVLTMPSWVVYRSRWDWQGWLAERAPALYTARGLVIDIRGNEGGLSCGDPILARLAGEDIVLDEYRQQVRFRSFPAALDPYAVTPVPSFRTLGVGAVPLGDGFYGQDSATTPVPRIAAVSPRLTTPTVILVDASNSSATFLFALRAKEHGLATLVGAQTGGNRRGINAGAVAFVTLPGSGIEFDLPLVGYYPASPQPDRGVLPEIAVETSAADMASGRDPQMEAALAQLR
ncbi:peptidase S41 [Alteriqipengyuania sp. NZ-12B]|uniref:Peptidase S41 n=1 Tax=Alteriqipengyuania abyssalis TaxID=2860200 RepID=A0ABS7PDQ7_9SPHN|nr:S41 family peptidase [Alteriqipengyuania abyssalis]MBY8336822.1 peptidase S41 [Alteriqipengyuania abyssalis]